jgi:hypothetical protein
VGENAMVSHDDVREVLESIQIHHSSRNQQATSSFKMT